jgi:hypothetical protein
MIQLVKSTASIGPLTLIGGGAPRIVTSRSPFPPGWLLG